MRFPFLLYGVSWFVIKCSNFAKGWDLITVNIVAAGALIVGIILFDLVKSLLRNGRDGILYTAVMIGGGITFILDEFFEIGWYLETGNKDVDMFIGWGMVAGVSLFTAYMWYLKVNGYKEE